MKKTLQKIVQISFLQLVLTLVLPGMALAIPAGSQGILDRRVSIQVTDVPLDNALSRLEKSAQVKFSYNSRMLQLNRSVSVHANNEVLAEVLSEMLEPLNISYIQVSNRIVLRKGSHKKQGLTEESRPEKILPPTLPSISISGVVKDEKGTTLTGVSVLVKGTTLGTATDLDGHFDLEVPDQSAVLVLSYLGYITEELAIGNQTRFNIILRPDTKALNEVVVVGYGVQKKKDLTGAITSVTGDLFKERKETQVSQALQGAMSGVMVTRSGGSGSMGGATIRIRGVTTIGDSNPLVIVDGVPVSDVNQVNPNDIENLTVLKDAASASIYGSRAASGVILISTKRAKSDQASIQYSYETGFDSPTQVPENMGALRYMQLVNELRWNDAGNGANQYPTFTQNLLDGYNEKHASNPDLYPDTDWLALTLNDRAPRQAHSISIIGGSKFVKSNASMRYEKVGGFYENKDYNRIFLRSNNDFTINQYVGGTVDFNFKRTIAVDPNVGNPLYVARISAPIYPAMWSDGRVADGKAGDNLYGRLLYGGTDRNWYNQIGGRIALDLKPLDGLKFSAILAPIFNFNTNKKFNKQVDAYAANDPTQFLVTLTENGGGANTTRLSEGRSEDYSLTTQFLANYVKTIGSHDFTLLAGYENYYFKSEYLGASRDQFLFDGYPYLDQGPITLRDNGGSAFETAYRSVFGRITYSFKDKYLIQANVRSDGSSRFNAAYRWGIFPSVSAGWVMSEEGFMQNQKIVSFLKLRASWGALGNERIGNYPSLGIISFSNALFYQNGAAISQQTAAQIQYAIQNISWEKTESTNLGLDAYFFKDRLRLSTDIYYKQTKDMLLALQIPIFVGFENPNQNTGVMSTKGIDLDLGWTDKIGQLNYSVSVNLSQFTSIMGDLGGTEFLGDQIKKEGSQFNEWYGYIAEGIYQNIEDVNSSPKLSANVKVGDMKYRDISGPNGVPDGRISPEYDRVLLGSSLPQWMYGGNVRLGYKAIDFALSFQGIGFQNSSALGYTSYNDQNFGQFPTLLDGQTWSAYNTPEQNLAAKYPRYTETNKGLNRALSSYWLFNGGYFRLKNITAGYTITPNSSKWMAKNLRIYLSASDLLSLSKYPKGWDPEGLGIVTTVIAGVSLGF